MKKFQFRLQRVLDVRRVRERLQLEKLYKAIRQRQREEKKLGILEKEAKDIIQVMRENQQKAFEVWAHTANTRYRMRVEAAKGTQMERIGEALQYEGVERKDFVEMQRHTRVLEKLQELRHKDWEREVSREEDKRLDEIAIHANNLRKYTR